MFKKYSKKLYLIIIVAIISYTAPAICKAENWQKEDYSIHAYIMMMEFVKDHLKTPMTAQFPEPHGRVVHLGNQRYRIVSFVDSQNAFGTYIRDGFVGEIEQSRTDYWVLKSLEFESEKEQEEMLQEQAEQDAVDEFLRMYNQGIQ